MSKKQLISIIYLGAAIIGSLVEFLLNGYKPPFIFNWWVVLPSLITVTFFSFISKPFMEWLDSPLKETIKTNKRDDELRRIKKKLANFLNNFGFCSKHYKKTKLIYWKEKDLWLALWHKRFLMYIESNNENEENYKLYGLTDGLDKGRFTIKDIDDFISRIAKYE